MWPAPLSTSRIAASALDLVYTPLAGIALGEARLALHRAASAFRSSAVRQVVRALVDPLGEIERAAGTDC